MTVEVKTRLGQLPTFWDRDVIFFANMLSIFYDNRCELERLRQQVMGTVSLYDITEQILNADSFYTLEK